jgi:DNA-binding beta-propeller fold protein YncE
MSTKPQVAHGLLWALSATFLAAACGDPAGNGSPSETVLVAAGNEGRFAVLRTEEGIISRPGPVPEIQDAFALSHDRTALYFTAVGTGVERALFAMDTRSFALTTHIALSELESRSEVSNLTLVGNSSMVLSPDGSRLLLADASHEGVTGVAVLDASSETPTGFIGPLSVQPDGLEATAPTAGAPDGQIFAIGTRTPGIVPRTDSLFVIDGATLTIQRAVAVAEGVPDGTGSLFEIEASPTGDLVYLLGPDLLYAYDVGAEAVVASAPAPRRGSIGVAPSGGTVYVTDPGDRREFSGSGLVLAFTAMLEPSEPIDLRPEALEGVFPPTEGVAIGAEGSRLYVVSGTGSRGPLFGPQQRRVFVVDAATGAVTERVRLDDYGGGPIFVLR